MKVLETIDLTKIYDTTVIKVTAVDHVNFSVEQGEFTAIVGPSGSGKTTFLNLIGGLDRPSSGKVIIDSIDLWSLKPRKIIDFRLHNIGFVFQSYNLLPVLSAAENVEFIMNLQGWPKTKRMERTRGLLEAVGLGDRMNARPSKLSGGQQQRVAVARALATKPKFILADEPTANLDSHSTENLLDLMEQLNRNEGMTFIFSTHDARVVKKAHRVVTLEDGKIVRDEKKS